MEINKFLAVLALLTLAAGHVEAAPPDTKRAVGSMPIQLADHVTHLGILEIRLLEGGYYKGEKGFYPGARLLFRNMDPKKHFRKNISIEFFKTTSGKRLSNSKTFLNLKPGQRLERSYAEPRGPVWISLEATPDIDVFVKEKGLSTGAMRLVRRPLLRP